MAISYSSNPPTQKPFSLLLAIFTTFLLLLATKVNSAKVVSFNFTKFTPGTSSITLQGSADILASGVLALTSHGNPNPSWNIGRALYTTPVTIWDETTGNVASFVTSFSFTFADINSESYVPADGIVLFLAPQDTAIPNGGTGGYLGVVNPENAFNNFVGVEFDNYANGWDPAYTHIGIDANSLISLRTVKWNKGSGSLFKVNIIYDSHSKTLSVALTNPNGRITTVAQVVDLKALLPSNVKVGFSAATSGNGVQKHDIHSWSFTSNLETTISSRNKENMNLASVV